jgi:hypothetical protein
VQEVLQEDEVVKVKVRERATTTVLSNRRVEDLERQGLKGMFSAANCSAVVWLALLYYNWHTPIYDIVDKHSLLITSY